MAGRHLKKNKSARPDLARRPRLGLKGSMLQGLAWSTAITAVYLSCLLLDVYWNLLNWKPRWDWPTPVLFACLATALLAIWFLARARQRGTIRVLSFLGCLGLVVAATVALPVEPQTTGLLGRDVPSPLWYRGARWVLMALPLGIWMIRRAPSDHLKPLLTPCPLGNELSLGQRADPDHSLTPPV